jgi:hypothetical protein
VPPRRPPNWGEVEAFCHADGWRQVRSTDHVFWEKVLGSSEVLQTHRSFSSDRPLSPGQFGFVLRTQLKVSREDFWRAVETGQPIERPSAAPAEPLALPLWVVTVLVDELHLSQEEISRLSPEEAIDRVHQHWSEPTD